MTKGLGVGCLALSLLLIEAVFAQWLLGFFGVQLGLFETCLLLLAVDFILNCFFR